jgi:6-phosphogluconolactonase
MRFNLIRSAPKPPPEPVSLSARDLTSSQDILILVTDFDKREALANWRLSASLPVARITSAEQRAQVLMDRATEVG